MQKIPIKKAHSKVTRTPINVDNLRDTYRDPLGRHPKRTLIQEPLPIPAQIVNMRGIAKPSVRAVTTKSNKKKEDVRLSDIL